MVLFKITRAAITPGTHPHMVKMKTMTMDPQPWSITARGGKSMESKTRIRLKAFFWQDNKN